jgi:general secretion pathway protein D
MIHKLRLVWLLAASLTSCSTTPVPVLQPVPRVPGDAGVAAPRVNATIGTPQALPPAGTSYAPGVTISLPGQREPSGGGDISLDFADTDIREVVAQILGNILRVNYTIDPAVRGSVTLHTATRFNRSQLLPTLQALLAENGATLIQTGSLYRVVPSAAAAGTTALATSNATAGTAVVPLQYASATSLVVALQPFIGNSAKIAADAASNTLLITAEPDSREALINLVRAFDVDTLAGQSYALLPVPNGGAKDFATALQEALRTQTGSAVAGQVRTLPLERINAVLVISSQPRYIDDARRVYDLVQRAHRQTTRSWHVQYLQNSRANDVAYILQQAFTPNSVTAQPTPPGQAAPGLGTQVVGTTGLGGGGGYSGMGGVGGITGTTFGSTLNPGAPYAPQGIGGGAGLGGIPGGAAGQPGARAAPVQPAATQNPLLGPLEPGAETTTDTMRIIPDEQNNAILIYATPSEEETVEAMLRKVDILPLQVRIDAVIAEVTLNDNLRYGTQYFFQNGGLNAILSSGSNPLVTVTQAAGTNPLLNTLPGFVIGGSNKGALFALSALQEVTTVQVLSAPELVVLDNQPARLQVGDLVPYLSQTSQSTLVAGAPIVNSVNYQQTGVIMQIVPRVNTGGMVSLDVAQEVSDVAPAVTTAGLDSPTFTTRNVTSRLVVQDGQTVGLAGLIRDSVSRGNQGIPWLKDIPLLGVLAGQQNNTRTRTELLILITPHVIHDQRDARALTEDLRDQLSNAAAVPGGLPFLKPSGSVDPDRELRRRLHLEP